MSEFLELYDYRRLVAAMCRERNESLMAGANPVAVWERFRAARDELFARHPQSALDEKQRRGFQSLPYFPYNTAMRFVADIDTAVEQTRHTMLMNARESMTLVVVGKVHFVIEDQPMTLSIYWLDIYGGGLFLPFRDTTCAKESYSGGRYLFDTIKGSDFLAVPGSGGQRIMLDFNYAYNPSCAYNSRWICPLAPAENHLAVAIRAGERKQALALQGAA